MIIEQISMSSRRQMIDIVMKLSIVHGGVRASLYPADWPAAAQLVENYDDPLFCHLINYEQHVLHAFLPE